MTDYMDDDRIYGRLVYQRRVAAMPRYYVGQRTVDDGSDAVDDFARAQLETLFADAALARVVHLLWSHGISNATMDPGSSPGDWDSIRIQCGSNDSPMPGEVLGSTRWVVYVYWAQGVLAEGTFNPRDVAVQAWTESDRGDEDSHLAHVLVPFGLNPTNDDVMDVCEAIVSYIYDNAIPLSEVPGH
jgi:hypothetical protein